MSYRGDFSPGATVRVPFNTRSGAGAPVTLAGSPTFAVYKDGSTTESGVGVTLSVDKDSRTGLHEVVIDTSADAGFYAGGSDFEVVLTSGTADGVSGVGFCPGSFSLNNRSVRDSSGVTTTISRLTHARGIMLDNLDASISSRSSHSAADVWAVSTRTLSSFGTLVSDVATAAATAVWAFGSRTLSAFGFNVTVGGYAGGQRPDELVIGRTDQPLSVDDDGAVLVSGVGSAAIQPSSFSDNAITGLSLSSTAVTKLQNGLATASTQSAHTATLARILGLSQQNWVLRDPAYDGDGNLTAATIRAYDTAGHATTDDGATGLVATWAFTATYADGRVTGSKQVEQ